MLNQSPERVIYVWLVIIHLKKIKNYIDEFVEKLISYKSDDVSE